MEIKSKLYLGTMLLIKYMVEQNLFMRRSLLQDMQLHGFLSEQISPKKNKRKDDTRMAWYLRPRACKFFIQKFHLSTTLYWLYITL